MVLELVLDVQTNLSEFGGRFGNASTTNPGSTREKSTRLKSSRRVGKRQS
jgi:hypothetical protein